MARTTFRSFTKNLDVTDLRWMPEDGFSPARLRIELLSGLTVALALVPEAVAFAFVAGVHPLVGLYAAFLVGLITALIGGRPGMISGATGALAVVMVALVSQHGVEYLFATVILMGLLQVFAGVMQWGATMAIIWVMPRITRFIPAPLAGIGIVAAVVIFTGMDVPRVGDLASIQGGFPMPHNPFGEGPGLYGTPLAPLTLETFGGPRRSVLRRACRTRSPAFSAAWAAVR